MAEAPFSKPTTLGAQPLPLVQLGAVLAVVLGGFAVHGVSLINSGKIANSPYNWSIAGAAGLAGIVCLLPVLLHAGASATKRPGDSLVPATKPGSKIGPGQQRALSELASFCLSDPIAMDLVQRLAYRLDGNPGATTLETARPVPAIMQELELRLRQEMVATISGGVLQTGVKS